MDIGQLDLTCVCMATTNGNGRQNQSRRRSSRCRLHHGDNDTYVGTQIENRTISECPTRTRIPSRMMSASMSTTNNMAAFSVSAILMLMLLLAAVVSPSAAFQFTNRYKIGVTKRQQQYQQQQQQQTVGRYHDLGTKSIVWGNRIAASVYSRQLIRDRINDRGPPTSCKFMPLFALNGSSPSSSSKSSSSSSSLPPPVPITASTSTTKTRTNVSESTIQRRRLRLLTKVLSNMSSPRLLQYLDTYHVRYAPTATRHDLERLILSHIITNKEGRTINKNGKRSTSGRGAKDLDNAMKGENIVRVIDAEVVSHDNDAQQIQKEGRGSNREVTLPQQQQQRRISPQSNQRSERGDNMGKRQYIRHGGKAKSVSSRDSSSWGRRPVRARARVWSHDHGEESNQPHRRRRSHRPQSTRQQDVPREGRRNYNIYATNRGASYSDVIDLDDHFRLDSEEEDTPRSQIYDNGLQIFLMGFYEAGKAATRLVTDAVVDAVLDGANGASESLGSGRWRHDHDVEEEREEWGRQVADADVLNFYPRVGNRRRRRRSSNDDYYSDGVRSPGRRGGTEETLRDTYAPIHGVKRLLPPRRRAEFYEDPRKESWEKIEEGRVSSDMLPSEIPITGGNETDIEYQSRRFSNDDEDNIVGGDSISDSKRIYGLYADEQSQQTSERNIMKAEREIHHKRQWKDRLRRKFDDALGLHTPISYPVTSHDAYYDSWKIQMAGVDDGRKEVLRRQLNENNNSSAVDTPSTYRNNRRARMRAKSNLVGTRSSSRQLENKSLSRSQLDEVPFWRESGTIASLLFDNQQSPSRPTRRSRTLEQLLLSPFGRGHTVTSLFLYISRSVLTAFGILCRWAGVRGTIPQPIVVTSVVAVIVSSRRGQRMISLALTILTMRLMGEFIHGSLHGNEFWDDEYDFRSHNWKEENNAR